MVSDVNLHPYSVDAKPVPSILRDFSAPVKLSTDLSQVVRRCSLLGG